MDPRAGLRPPGAIRVARRRRSHPAGQRPGRRRFAPGPTCVACARPWPRSARFCGWCGDPLPRGHLAVSRQRHPGRWVAARAGALVAAGLLGTAAALVALVIGSGGPAVEVGAVPEASIQLPQAPVRSDTTRSATVCSAGAREPDACVVPLMPDHLSRGMITPLPPDALLVALGGELRRFEVASGRLTWRVRPFEAAGGLRVRADGDAVLVSRPGEVALVDAEDGTLRWTRSLPTPPARAAPRAWNLDGDVLVLDTARVLRALDGRDGRVLWSIDDVSPEVAATTHGLLATRAGELGLWHPATPTPAWARGDLTLLPLRLPDGRPASAPIRLLVGRDLLVPESGERIEVHTPWPSTIRVLDDVTLFLHWPGPDRLELTALGAGGQRLWQRDDVALACCVATGADASGARIVLGNSGGPYEVLDRDTGARTAIVDRPGATLEGIAGELVIWREGERLIGTDLATGEEVVRTSGIVRALDPLLVSGPEGLIHIRIQPDARSQAPPRARSYARGTAS